MLTLRVREVHELTDVQLVSELDITGGDEKKVGYYAGMIVSHSMRFLLGSTG